MSQTTQPAVEVEKAVRDRYGAAAHEAEAALCCPVDYDPKYLDVIPAEIIERDYGCGDPSKHLKSGETVLDLGSGTGKICYIASQVVGPSGQVIGIDVNDEMLTFSESHRQTIAERIGHSNVRFVKGRIQDLALDLRELESYLAEHPIRGAEDLDRLRDWENRQRRERPLIADDSVDVIVSNCVLNLVRAEDKRPLFDEMFRVLRRNGRVVISDIVCDEDVPQAMQNDPTLWSGCISGAFREDAFLKAFQEAGFHGIRILKRDEKPWQTVEGIEFRSLTVEAFKGKQGACLERNQAVVYKGPWKCVTDDDGHTFYRGQRMAVCDKTFQLMQREPYCDKVEAIPPRVDIPLADAKPFDCSRNAVRPARHTKGEEYRETNSDSENCSGPDAGCC